MPSLGVPELAIIFLIIIVLFGANKIPQIGKGIGEGARPADLLADRKTVAEGAFTAPVLKRAAEALGVDMPIVAAVNALLAGEASVDEAVGRLLARPLRAEGV